nr:choice-of-anchor P family protein [Kibdelosporangium sp. MJ126-NF4]CEL23065.1 hypothetical protein [Kibdelosporangium sp. MJ126-NF4]CTQ90203.1 hypothetical protein [Kibdelosporangium sp. MJ126-NF4]
MKKSKVVRGGSLVAVAVAAAVLANAAPAAAATPAGSADALTVDIRLSNGVIPVGQVGPLAQSNTTGPTSNQIVNVDIPLLVAGGSGTTHSTQDAATGAVHSDAQMGDVKLRILDTLTGNPPPLPSQYTIKAVESHCDSTTAGFTGDSKLSDVKLGPLPIPVAFPPNTRIGIPTLGEAIFNEQIMLPDGRFSVTALHVTFGGPVAPITSGDVWLARSICGPASPPVPMASGAGLWIGLGLLGMIAIPVGSKIVRSRRRAATIA